MLIESHKVSGLFLLIFAKTLFKSILSIKKRLKVLV